MAANTIPEPVPLHDNRPGLRSLLQVEVREVSAAPASEAGAGGSSATLDFIASTATLDRYREIIEPAGWRLDSYRSNPVFQNAHNYGDIDAIHHERFCHECRGGDPGSKRPYAQGFWRATAAWR